VLLSHQVREEYRLGYRTSTDGDSIGIPIFGFAINLTIVMLAANGVWFLIRYWRRRSRAAA
jgi:hypothetical protein